MKQNIILFDVDKTLINTTQLFKEKIVKILLNEVGISSEEYQSLEKEYQQTLDKYTDFDPFGLLKFITKQDDVSDLHQTIFGNKQFYLDAVFEDVRPTIEELKKEYRVGVFSEAVPEWQKFKLEMADLTNYFEPELTFIGRRKTEQSFLEKIPAKAIIIDDNPSVIAELIAFNQFQPIWLNRLEKENQVNTITITSLYELPTVLTTI
jgi:FMN phosphatase YigB (HAD superfamily)